VLNDAVSGVTEVQTFFTDLQQIYTFFGHSIDARPMSLLAIEAARAKTMDTDDLINQFAEMKARKVDCH